MADFKNKFKSWLGSEKKNSEPQAPSDVSQMTQTPEEKTGSPAEQPQTPAPKAPDIIALSAKEKAEWESRHADLLQQQEEAQKMIAQLAQELANSRQQFQESFRQKEEERIKLLAQVSMSDQRTQSLLNQQKNDFNKIQMEALKEIETLEKRLQEENVSWSKTLHEQEKAQEKFLVDAEFNLQEKQLDKKRKEQELERSLGELQNQVSGIRAQLETQQKQWSDQIKAIEEENVSQRSQIQLKESNRRIQEQRFQQDLSQARSEWDQKIRSLEIRLEQERQKWHEQLMIKESELQSVRLEQERKEAALKFSLNQKDEEFLSAKARAEAKLKAFIDQAKEMRLQNETDLKNKKEETEKLRVELMLLESQLKVDEEKAESDLAAIQKDAAGKLAFLEKKLQEEGRVGQKAVESKQGEIQSIELQFAIKRKALDDEFNQKKNDIDVQKRQLQEKIREVTEMLEKEREQHRLELTARDEMITSLKQEASFRAEEMRQKREQFTVEFESKKQEMLKELARLEETARMEKQARLESFNEQGRVLSEKKAALAREQAVLQHALKKQEDQLMFEILPLKNQLQDQKNRLEQERASRSKISSAKEEILQNLKTQKAAKEEQFVNEIKQHEARLKEEEAAARGKVNQLQKKWEEEKKHFESALLEKQNELAEIEKEIALLPSKAEAENRQMLTQHQKGAADLGEAEKNLQLQIGQETREFEKISKDLEDQRIELEKNLNDLLLQSEQERKDQEQRLLEAKAQWQQRINRANLEIQKERKQSQALIDKSQAKINALNQELAATRAKIQDEQNELEQSWQAENRDLGEKIASLQKDYDDQKLNRQNTLSERSDRIKELERQIEAAKQNHDAAVLDLQERKKAAEEEFTKRTTELEARRETFRTESEQKLRVRQEELTELERALKEFVNQSQEFLARRTNEIAQSRAELKNRQSSLEEQSVRESQEWPQLLAQKDSAIAFLKNVLELKEAEFRAQWENSEKDFDQFKKTATDKIQSLQKSILSEHNSVELRIAELQKEIDTLLKRRALEEEKAQQIRSSMEDEFLQVKTAMESEIAELEKKILQEKSRAEQQLKVKEMEIASLQKSLEQREIQRNLARETRDKEIAQERSRLLDWEKALQQRLDKEKETAEKVLSAKQQESDALNEKIRLQDEKFHSEKTLRQNEILEARTKMEIRIKELSKTLEDESNSATTIILGKQQELEQLSNRLNLWNENRKVEEDEERVRWENEKRSLEQKIEDLEERLKQEKSELDQPIQEITSQIAQLQQALAQAQQRYYQQLNEFQQQKSQIASEQEQWELRLKEERTRAKEEIRHLEREIERSKVEISLKETQVSIEKQKRERETRWALRPMESKLTDLKRRWEEKEREKKRRYTMHEMEREKLQSEIYGIEQSIEKELKEREFILEQLKETVLAKLKEIRNDQEGAPDHQSLDEKRKQFNLLQSKLQTLEAMLAEMGQKNPEAGTDSLKLEIQQWESKLAGSADEEKGVAEKEKAAIQNLQQQLSQKKKDLTREEMKSLETLSKSRGQSERVLNALNEMGEMSDAKKQDHPEKLRRSMESGIAAYAAGNDAEALVYFNQALNLDPASAVCHQMKGFIYKRQGNKKLALESFEKALSLDPQNETVRKHIQNL